MERVLKRKAKFMLRRVDQIRKVVEGFKADFSQIIKPEIRRAVVDKVETIEQNIMKEVHKKSHLLDPLINVCDEELWIRLFRSEQPQHVQIDVDEQFQVSAQIFVDQHSNKNQYYLRLEKFKEKLSTLKQRILNGEFDRRLYEDPFLLIFEGLR